MSGVVASLVVNFLSNTAGFVSGAGLVKGELNKLKSGAGGVQEAINSLGLAGVARFLTISGAVATTTMLIKKALTTTAEYSDQIRELGRTTGMTTEQSSRLLQVADDSQVSFSSLTASMKIAIRQGFNPTIESLADLSDAYLALEDPLQRSQMLLQMFGRNGLEMSKIMELGSEAIKQIGMNADKFGLVMSSFDVATMREYERAVNDLQTAFKGLGVQFALSLGPQIARGINGFIDYSTRFGQFNKTVALGKELLREDVIGIEDFTRATSFYNYITADTTRQIEMLNDGLEASGANFRINSDWTRNYGNGISGLAGEMAKLAAAIDEVKNIDDVITSIKDIDLKVGGEIVTTSKQIQFKGLGGDVISSIHQGIISATDQGIMPPEVSQKFLEDLYVIEQAAEVEMGNIDFTQAGKNLEEGFGIPADIAEQKVRNVGNTTRAINGLKSRMDIYIYVHTIYIGGGNPFGGTRLQGSGDPSVFAGVAPTGIGSFKPSSGVSNFVVPPGYAQGGQFIVPRGFSGMSSGYPIMVHSGERVNVDTASKTQVDNDALLSELQGMRSELATLKTSIRDAVLMAV